MVPDVIVLPDPQKLASTPDQVNQIQEILPIYGVF